MSLFDFILTKKLQRKEIPARSTCHVSRERAILDLIELRKHDSAIISKLWKKTKEEMSRTHEERKGEEASSPLHVTPSRGLWLDNYQSLRLYQDGENVFN